MKIRIALIQSKHVAEAHELVGMLQKFMEAGEMQAVDQTSEKLLSLSDKEHSVSITEESWHQLISSIRDIDENFKADYLLEGPQIQEVMSADLGELYSDIVEIMNKALELKSIVLQLPLEEENLDV